MHFFGKKGKAELKFEDFYKWVQKASPLLFDKWLSNSVIWPWITFLPRWTPYSWTFSRFVYGYAKCSFVLVSLRWWRFLSAAASSLSPPYRFMDNLQTEVLEIEFLCYSKGLLTISEEDFARILLRYTNVDDVSRYLENVCHSIPDEKVHCSSDSCRALSSTRGR